MQLHRRRFGAVVAVLRPKDGQVVLAELVIGPVAAVGAVVLVGGPLLEGASLEAVPAVSSNKGSIRSWTGGGCSLERGAS